MKKVAVLVAALVAISGTLGSLPCDSQLRIVLPDLFKHCANHCPYGQWSSWKIINKTRSENCESKNAYFQKRTRHSFIKNCSDENETRYACKFYIVCFYTPITK